MNNFMTGLGLLSGRVTYSSVQIAKFSGQLVNLYGQIDNSSGKLDYLPRQIEEFPGLVVRLSGQMNELSGKLTRTQRKLVIPPGVFIFMLTDSPCASDN